VKAETTQFELEENQKRCLSECPKCGATGNDLDWDATDIAWGEPSTAHQTATCLKCGIDFCEVMEFVYLYTEIIGDN